MEQRRADFGLELSYLDGQGRLPCAGVLARPTLRFGHGNEVEADESMAYRNRMGWSKIIGRPISMSGISLSICCPGNRIDSAGSKCGPAAAGMVLGSG